MKDEAKKTIAELSAMIAEEEKIKKEYHQKMIDCNKRIKRWTKMMTSKIQDMFITGEPGFVDPTNGGWIVKTTQEMIDQNKPNGETK